MKRSPKTYIVQGTKLLGKYHGGYHLLLKTHVPLRLHFDLIFYMYREGHAHRPVAIDTFLELINTLSALNMGPVHVFLIIKFMISTVRVFAMTLSSDSLC